MCGYIPGKKGVCMGPSRTLGKVLRQREFLPICFCAVQHIYGKPASSEGTLLSLCNDCWNCRSRFSHLHSDVSESMNRMTDCHVDSVCITVALRELSLAQDLTEVFSARSQRWDLTKRPCSPVGKTVSAHTIPLIIKKWSTDSVLYVKFNPYLLSCSAVLARSGDLSLRLWKNVQVWWNTTQWRNSTSALLAVAQVHTEDTESKIRSNDSLLLLWLLLLQIPVTAAKTLKLTPPFW